MPPSTPTTPAKLLSPGIRYMALSAFFFSLMSMLVKLAGRTFPTMELVFARAAVVSGLAYAEMRRRGIRLRNPDLGLLLVRGAVGLAALACFYYAVIHLPLAEATVIYFTNPVWTALVAAAFLAEALRPRELALAVVSLLGVVLVVRPFHVMPGGGVGLPTAGVAAALGGAVLAAGAYTLVRRLRKHDAMVVVFWFAAVSVVGGFPLMLPSFVWPHGLDWLLLFAVGVATFLGQVTMTLGLQRERAGLATAVSYLQIIFAATWGVLIFGEGVRWTTAAGAVVIVGSMLLAAHLRRRESVPSGEE
jgi:drug/metabolite transporter (DMT)-like permease